MLETTLDNIEEDDNMLDVNAEGSEVEEISRTNLPDSLLPTAPLLVHEHYREEATIISREDATRILYETRVTTTSRTFILLVPVGEDQYRVHEGDPTNRASMAEILPSEGIFITTDRGKRLKTAAAADIIDAAASEDLSTALLNTDGRPGKMIRQFQGQSQSDSEDELPHKSARQINVGQEIVKNHALRIRIMLWQGRDFKIIDKNVSYGDCETKVRQYLNIYKEYKPMDWEGNIRAIEECFKAAQEDNPPAIYLGDNEAIQYLSEEL
jgi:hypothetical protein